MGVAAWSAEGVADVTAVVAAAGELCCLVRLTVVLARGAELLLEAARLLMKRSACLTLSWSQVLLRSLVASANGMATP